jgi:hypothetical protein
MTSKPPFFTIGAIGSGYNINVNSLNFIGSAKRVTTSGLTTTPSFFVSDTNNQVGIIPNASASALNPLTAVNDSLIYSYGPTIGTENIVLSTRSATTSGVKITPTSALIGAGGSTTTPTASVSCSGATVTITGDPVITNRNIVVDNNSSAITVGNGASTDTANIILTKSSLASTKNFTIGNNTIIGDAAGNSLLVGSGNNTFVGYSAGSLTTGSNNTCIGKDSHVPDPSLSNQITIGSIYNRMYIQGGHNWRVGPVITGNISLTAPLAQFYIITAAATITLPTPVAALSGAHVLFRRFATGATITFTSADGSASMVAFNSLVTSTSVSMTSAQFQCELICSGSVWSQLNMS